LKGLAGALLLLLLTACSGLLVVDKEQAEESRPEAATPSDAIEEVQLLNRRGSRTKALNILRENARKYPDNPNIQSLLKKMEASWKIEKQLLEDRMLITEVRGLLETLPMLEQLASGDPNDFLLKSRLLFWEKYLQFKVDSLLLCGKTEREVSIPLALECLQQANQIAPSKEITRQMEEIDSQLDQRKQASIERRILRKRQEQASVEHRIFRERQEQASVELKQQKRLSRQVQTLMVEADRDIVQGSLTNAMLKLDKALEQDPGNPGVRTLVIKAQSAMDAQVEALVKLGDSLYRSEQIGSAVAVWEAALKLKPDQELIAQKIDRARKVLEKLEAIRSIQPAS